MPMHMRMQGHMPMHCTHLVLALLLPHSDLQLRHLLGHLLVQDLQLRLGPEAYRIVVHILTPYQALKAASPFVFSGH